MELARVQVLSGHQVIVYSPDEREGVAEVDGVQVRSVRCVVPGPLQSVELQIRAIRDAKGLRPDIIHFHSQPEGAALDTRGSARHVLSYDFFHFRGKPGRIGHPVYRRLLQAFDLLLPCSHYCLTESSRYWRLPSCQMRVLYNGVNVAKFLPDPESGRRQRDELGISGRVVLYVGRVCSQKGTDILLDAIERLKGWRDDVQLVIVGPIGQFGEPHEPDIWSARIRSLGGIYLGAVDEKRLPGIYNMADVFVMPTRAHEMFAMAAVEAEACGKPVVASDHGGLRETVPEGCGLRFPVGDVPALAANLETLLDDRALAESYGRQAHRHAQQFSWHHIAARLDDLYATL
jgi:glycosyltransferase involved in cell wall biosynthesis